MHIIKSAIKLTHYLNEIRAHDKNVTLGFVPTMGALHEGHICLINESVIQNDITVCSIFVNPTQFGDKSDLEKYPKPIERDIDLLLASSCDILFLPEYDQIYPNDYIHKTYDLDGLEYKIEGASRPGHFQGVCNVVARFFEIIKPDNAYFGQKDFQQTVVIKRLVKLLQLSVKLHIVAIKREPNGLAMSSRNVRLSEKGRKNAAFIYKALVQIKEDALTMPLKDAMAKAKQFISAQKGTKIDYLLAVDSTTLEEVEVLEAEKEIAILTVVEYEGVRLLDNIIL